MICVHGVMPKFLASGTCGAQPLAIMAKRPAKKENLLPAALGVVSVTDSETVLARQFLAAARQNSKKAVPAAPAR